MEKPLPVAICAVINRGSLLLIQRSRGDYSGLWALPGGKIELGEHVSAAAVREVKEETGIACTFSSLLALVSEHLVEEGTITNHFLLHLCELHPQTAKLRETDAGQLKWFRLSDIERHEGSIIPSDFMMIRNIIKQKQGTYFECSMEKNENVYTLKGFEPVG